MVPQISQKLDHASLETHGFADPHFKKPPHDRFWEVILCKSGEQARCKVGKLTNTVTPRHENSMKTQCGTCYRNCKKRGMYRGKHDETSRNFRARPLYSRICRIPCELHRLPSTLEITTMPRPILLWGIVCCTVPRKIVRLGLLKIKGSDSILKFWPLSVSFYPSKQP